MKVNNLFLVGVAALSLGMTACNNEDVPQVNNPGEGTTFAGMYISAMKDVSTRAVKTIRKIMEEERKRVSLRNYSFSQMSCLKHGC